MIRLFAAVPMPEAIGQALAHRQRGIEAARWSPPQTLHLTLRFFGDLREDVARDLDAELVALRARPFEIALAGVGAFGEGPEAHVVWAGVSPSPPLAHLAKACEGAARRAGLKPDTRTWRPHVTLAYLKRPDPGELGAWIQANNLLKSPPIAVGSFGLYSSFLGSEQAHHRLEAEYPLA
ncbi:RNA 2',3'-cyclic phosphodiesterase [Phenylobacterium sp.]|jgi:2'-5' RNA ligase|uniref:RNA 2',3'-cyclic phosphodiesterase n=1 Tax=Phenylobacterium sp. TaxID=1871053 RepID=UPI002F400630